MISTATNSISYSGNNSTSTAYAIPFPFLDREDFSVIVTDDEGVEDPLVYGTDFTVSTTLDSHGRITAGSLLTVAAVPVASSIAIKRVTEAVQSLNLTSGGSFPAESLETALDRVTMIAQEARRDVTNDGVTNVEAAGTGLVVQTAAGVYATRTISPAAGTPMTVTDGNGVAGNPTIELDLTLLDEETEAEDDDLIPALINGDLVLIQTSNLLNRTVYKEMHFNARDCNVGGGSSGISIVTHADAQEEMALRFTSTATGSIIMNFLVPEDYAGGAIKVKFRNRLVSGVDGEQFVYDLLVYDNAPVTATLITGAGGEYAQTHAAANTWSTAMSLGEDLEAGKLYQLFIQRDGADPLDDTSRVLSVTDIVIQYPAAPNLTGW